MPPANGVAFDLSLDVYLRFACAADAQRITRLHVQDMMARRSGALRSRAAYIGNVPTLVQTWHATLQQVEAELLSREANPQLPDEDGMIWAAIKYGFILTNPLVRS